MGILSALTGMIIETAKLPIDVAVDVLTLNHGTEYSGTIRRLEKIKEEAEKADK